MSVAPPDPPSAVPPSQATLRPVGGAAPGPEGGVAREQAVVSLALFSTLNLAYLSF